MIPLFLDDGTRNPFTFGGLTFQSPTADPNDVFEINGVVTTAAFDGPIDSGPSHDGAILAPAKRVYYLLRVDGVIRAKTYSALYDKKRSLAAAVDPARASLANSSTVGVTALDFNVPTEDLTNFPSGLAASRYYARARTGSTPPDSIYQGRNAPFSLDLIVPDPRRVAQSLTTKVNSGSATNLGDNPSPTTLSIAMAGAGSATFSIARAGTLTGTKTLALDLSGRANLDVVTVDMLTGLIQVNGVTNMGLLVGVGGYWEIEPGLNTLTVTNGTNATVTTSWRHAWVI